MTTQKVDAIICSCAENIYYLTNYFPQLEMMGMENIVYAILPRDRSRRPILVVGQFEYYLAAAERGLSDLVDIRLFTMPAEPETFARLPLKERLDLEALPSFLPTEHGYHALSSGERFKRFTTNALSKEVYASAQTALLKQVLSLDLEFKNIAVDSIAISTFVERAELQVNLSNAERLLRSIRLQKSEAEIALMKFAAKNNAEAGLTAAKIARDGGTFQDIRREFHRQCASRYMNPKFMVIDSVIPEAITGDIKQGQAFAIDCVSHGQYYHGDYGRTVCVGEPSGELAKAAAAIGQVWTDLLPQLKPGMRYSEIQALATTIFKNSQSNATFICNPHSVGLHHTDEPSATDDYYFVKDDLTLMEGMVLSVDLPVIDVGLGGSAHLEDLVLIGKDGASLLNDPGDKIIIV